MATGSKTTFFDKVLSLTVTFTVLYVFAKHGQAALSSTLSYHSMAPTMDDHILQTLLNDSCKQQHQHNKRQSNRCLYCPALTCQQRTSVRPLMLHLEHRNHCCLTDSDLLSWQSLQQRRMKKSRFHVPRQLLPDDDNEASTQAITPIHNCSLHLAPLIYLCKSALLGQGCQYT